LKNIRLLKNSPLFSGISENELESLVKCLGCSFKSYGKGESVHLAGDFVREIGVVTNGKMRVIKDDAWGNSNILAELSSGEMFAEAFVCSGVRVLPVSVLAATDAEAMFADFQRIITQCGNACAFHGLLIRNIIGVLARKNIMLQGKMEHITKRTTKEKLLSYLSEQSRQHGSREFEIPFDRQGLADYLSVERSALSAEMSKLKSGGVINYRKSRFELAVNVPDER
jgi:CRP-like cAMP-binding protein